MITTTRQTFIRELLALAARLTGERREQTLADIARLAG